MRSLFNLAALFILLLLSACGELKKDPEIVLDRVYFLPEYFTASYHFGKDLDSIEHLNEYLLVTGKIDTTSETPAIKLGVIAINKQKIYLTLVKSETNSKMTNEIYSGAGYRLHLSYKEYDAGLSHITVEGKLTIAKGNLNAEYKIVGEPGYQ